MTQIKILSAWTEARHWLAWRLMKPQALARRGTVCVYVGKSGSRLLVRSETDRPTRASVYRRRARARCARAQTRGPRSRHPPEHSGGRETVMDYRHIWAVISRSHIPPAFSGRQESCIMVSHRRARHPGLPCQCACERRIISLFTCTERNTASGPRKPFFFFFPPYCMELQSASEHNLEKTENVCLFSFSCEDKMCI